MTSGQSDSGSTANDGDLSETTRLEAFSDGVFAIAITLLVLNVHIPQLTATEPSLAHALLRDWPTFTGYALSFVTIGIMWANHHNMLKYIRRSDHNFRMLNVLFLLFVAFLPYPTSLVTAFIRDPASLRTSVMVYSGTMLVIALMFNAVWWYAYLHPRLLAVDADPVGMRTISRRYFIGPASYAIGFALAFVSSAASLLWLGALAVLYSLPERKSS